LTERAPDGIGSASDVSGVIGQVAFHDWGLHSSIGVPVSAKNRLWGCIVVAFSGQELLPLPRADRRRRRSDPAADPA
jgi:hypothetical protein